MPVLCLKCPLQLLGWRVGGGSIGEAQRKGDGTHLNLTNDPEKGGRLIPQEAPGGRGSRGGSAPTQPREEVPNGARLKVVTRGAPGGKWR